MQATTRATTQASISLTATDGSSNSATTFTKRVQRKLPYQSALLLKLVKTFICHVRLLGEKRSATLPVNLDQADPGSSLGGFAWDLAVALKGSQGIPVAAELLLKEQVGSAIRLLRIDGRPYLAVCLDVLPDELT